MGRKSSTKAALIGCEEQDRLSYLLGSSMAAQRDDPVKTFGAILSYYHGESLFSLLRRLLFISNLILVPQVQNLP
jgi:hypothetical protein